MIFSHGFDGEQSFQSFKGRQPDTDCNRWMGSLVWFSVCRLLPQLPNAKLGSPFERLKKVRDFSAKTAHMGYYIDVDGAADPDTV